MSRRWHLALTFVLSTVLTPPAANADPEQAPVDGGTVADTTLADAGSPCDAGRQQSDVGDPGTDVGDPGTDAGAPESRPAPVFETVVTGTVLPWQVPEGRASSHVGRTELDQRLPRSSPDALRYEPGVFVQQTAHGQGSAYIRGFTGQQTLLLFDGIRINNSTYRQGPNQYFFTLDSRSIDSIDVLRGGASSRFGSDALGGVVAASPIEPRRERLRSGYHPTLFLRGASADKEYGGRMQLEGALLDGLAFVGGVGGRRAGLLEGGGIVRNPADGGIPQVPRFASDGRTQLGTGFRELTLDGRITYRGWRRHKLTVAGYGYRQYDAPRTDQCPPPGGRFDECLRYDEQFRTLVYVAWDGRDLGRFATNARATLSWQRQHERRTNSRPASFVENLGRDDVDSYGVTVQARTSAWQATDWLSLALSYGADTYWDAVDSRAWLAFTDVDITVERRRGQYLSGSTYLYGGSFLDLEVQLLERLVFKTGGRASWIAARAPGDQDSGSMPIRSSWYPVVGHIGAEWFATQSLVLLANLDRSFRAPNLDDLTSRQQTGPGFQFESPSLKPERGTTVEVGARLRSNASTVELWAFRTLIDDAVGKRAMEVSDCPPATPQCQASWFRYQLANAPGVAEVRGLELLAQVRLPYKFAGRSTVAWTWGEGPNLAYRPTDPTIPYKARVPLSRIPPLNGTAELHWTHKTYLTATAALRWATLQDRLAVADLSDARIPLGGTPGFVVLDLRASYRLDTVFVVSGVIENLFDAAYRYHGSSVNGPGRGVIFSIQFAPL